MFIERIFQLEKNAVNNVKYYRHESIEINSVPVLIRHAVLESNICKALPDLSWGETQWFLNMTLFEEKRHFNS